MRTYDPNHPLIVIHIPKTAGMTTERFYKRWFKDGFLRHYYIPSEDKMPEKFDLFGMHSKEKPIVLHGHFNKLRNFGIADYYPKADQFITILRDPFEQMVSTYFFVKKVGINWKDKSRIPKGELRDFLFSRKPNMLNHFPKDVTMYNYKDIIETFFIEIGITEHLEKSMKRIARKLNFDYYPELLTKRLNATERDQYVPYELKEEFKEKNKQEYAVYNYALGKLISEDSE